jgi:hypothetical protein
VDRGRAVEADRSAELVLRSGALAGDRGSSRFLRPISDTYPGSKATNFVGVNLSAVHAMMMLMLAASARIC